MTTPSRSDAAALLLSLDPPRWFLRHSRAVAEIAAWLAVRAERRGTPVDRAAVEAAALLHDVDKLLPASDPACELPHAEGSADWLTRRGHAELAPLVARHPVTCLLDGERPGTTLAERSLEAHIVAYADKRAGQRLEPMADRFASWERRYPGSWTPAERALVRSRADALERAVCEAAGVRPAEVRRLAWTRVALARARDREEAAA